MALFSGLSERLNHIFSKMRNRGKLTELEINQAMREIRVALLEADVNYAVAKQFVQDVSKQALGQQVLESLTPALESLATKSKLPEHIKEIKADDIKQVKLIDATPIGINIRSTVASLLTPSPSLPITSPIGPVRFKLYIVSPPISAHTNHNPSFLSSSIVAERLVTLATGV